MSGIRCLLVDDEPPAIQLLEKFISMVDDIKVQAKFSNAVRTLDYLKENDIDLLFLDIRMPVINGIDFLKSLKNPPAIILTTAYREYALEGYDLDIVDYLLKPIAFDRFLKAIDRYKNISSAKSSAYIMVNVNRTKHKIILADIVYIESLKDYVRIHTSGGNLVVKGNLGSFMKLIPSGQFVRIHRSYAIALAHLKSFNQREVEITGMQLPIGVSYRGVLNS